MAGGRMVNLGQVGFGLVADDAALKASLDLLKAFGKEVDRVGQLSGDASQKLFAAFRPMEATLTRAQVSTEQTIRALEKLGASKAQVEAVTQAFVKFNKEVIDNAEKVGDLPNRLARGTIGLSAIQNRVLAEAKASYDERNRMQSEAIQLVDAHGKAIVEDGNRTMKALSEENASRQAFAIQMANNRATETAAVEKSLDEQIKSQQKYYQNVGKMQQQAIVEDTRRTQQSQAEQLRIMQQNANMSRSVGTLGVRATAVGIDPSFMAATQQNLSAFQATSNADPKARIASLMQLRDSMALVQQEVIKAGGVTNVFATALRDLERAAILAVGPLSGIGARLAVLSALFESTSFGTALAIAGVAGLGTAFALISTTVIKATMDMQRFEAILTASTGSAALVHDEYEKVSVVAEKWGFSVQGLIEPYAKFTTAARLSGLAVEDQKTVFEGVTVASRAMNLSTERTGLVFLALEQMLSKGTVNMEEMRRQLGDQLPGAFQLAATAMGKTQAEFTKAITSGQILATDLLPKLGRVLEQVFGPAAERASHNLSGEFGRLETAIFNLKRTVENTTGVTEAFTVLVVKLTSVVKDTSTNFREIVGWVGALAGAAGLPLLVLNLGSVVTALVAVGNGIKGVAFAMAGLNAATMANPAGAILTVLARLGLALAGGAIGYELFKSATKSTGQTLQEELKNWVTYTDEFISQSTKLGKGSGQTIDAEVAGTQKRIELAEEHLSRMATQLQELEILKASASKKGGMFNEDQVAPGAEEGSTAIDAKITKLKGEIAELQKVRMQLAADLTDLGGLKRDDPTNKALPGTQWENFIKEIQKQIRDTETLGKELGAAFNGEDAMRMQKAIGQMQDMMAKEPEKQKGGFENVIKDLREFGYVAKDVTPTIDQIKTALTKMFYDQDLFKKQIGDIQRTPGEIKKANDEIRKLNEQIDERQRAARAALGGGDTSKGKMKEALEVEKLTDSYRAQIDVLTKSRFTQEMIDKARAGGGAQAAQAAIDYNNNIDKTMQHMNATMEVTITKLRQTQALEDFANDIKKTTDEVNNALDSMGSRAEKANLKLQEQARLFAKAEGDGILTHEQAMDAMTRANDDAYRTMYGRTTEFGKAMHSFFSTFENEASRALVDPLLGVKSDWKSVFASLERTVFEFIAKIAVIQPMMKKLFGGLFTNQSADVGTGLLEGSTISLGKMFGANLGFSPESLDSGVVNIEAIQNQIMRQQFQEQQASVVDSSPFGLGGGIEDFLNIEGAFATGGSFTVGGSGGTDTQPVSFMATPGEKVDVRRPGDGGATDGVTVIINNQSGTPVSATASPPRMDGGQMVVELLLQRLQKDAGARQRISASLAAPQH